MNDITKKFISLVFETMFDNLEELSNIEHTMYLSPVSEFYIRKKVIVFLKARVNLKSFPFNDLQLLVTTTLEEILKKHDIPSLPGGEPYRYLVHETFIDALSATDHPVRNQIFLKLSQKIKNIAELYGLEC